MISHISMTTIVVKDQEASLSFFVDVLGWKVGMDMPMGPDMRWLTVATPEGKAQMALALPSWMPDDPKMIVGGSTGLALTTTDIDADYAAMTAKGVKFKGPVEMMPWGMKATWFYDLDDNEFYLIEAGD